MAKKQRRDPPTYYLHPERSSAGWNEWSPKFLRAIRRSGVNSISIGGPPRADVAELLLFAEQIEELVLDCPVADMSHLSQLPHLREFTLGYDTRLEHVDLTQLRRLEKLWVRRTEPLGIMASPPRLKELYISNCRLEDLAPLQNLLTLEQLNVTEAPLQRLTGIEQLRALKKLVVSQVPLSTLEGIEGAAKLEDVDLFMTSKLSSVKPLTKVKSLRVLSIRRARRIQDLPVLKGLTWLEKLKLENIVLPPALDFLSGLRGLRHLTLDLTAKIPSLGFLTPLKRLEVVHLDYGVTVEDGDLSLLLKLPALKHAIFFDRRHYSHSYAEIDAELARRFTVTVREHALNRFVARQGKPTRGHVGSQ